MSTDQDFYKQLHELAIKIAEEYSWEEENKSIKLLYSGGLALNYPWVYLEYLISGRYPLKTLYQIELTLEQFCAKHDFAFYEGASINQVGALQFKIVYHEAK